MPDRTLRFTTDKGDTIDFQFPDVGSTSSDSPLPIKVYVNGAGVVSASDDPSRSPELIHQLLMCGAEELSSC